MLLQAMLDTIEEPALSIFRKKRANFPGYLTTMKSDLHVPVMIYQVLHWLITDRDGIYFDGTLGDGGHARAVARLLNPGGKVIATDWDRHAVEHAETWRQPLHAPVSVYHASFGKIAGVLRAAGVDTVHGILLDLGMSSRQLDNAQRGFSYLTDGPLDMRMDQRLPGQAYDIINRSSADELKNIFYRYGEEKRSSLLAKIIVEVRKKQPITTTEDLIEVMKKRWRPAHFSKSASRIFQALRIAVNNELDILEKFLEECWDLLVPRGRIVVISYHSLEDRIVKQSFKKHENPCICPKEFPVCQCGLKADAKILTKKVIKPALEEIERNPRARSAKMRVAEKI